MKILQTMQKYMMYGGHIRGQGVFNKTHLWGFFRSFSLLVTLFVYLFRVANTQRQYTEWAFMATTGCLIFISYTDIALNTPKVFEVIDDFEQTINERLDNPKARRMYKKDNHLVEKISEIIQFVVVYVSPVGFVLPKGLLSFFVYFSTDLGADAFELPIPLWLPFDWKNPIGYSIAIALQIYIVAFTLRHISYMLSLAIGCYTFGWSLIQELKEEITSLNEIIIKKPSRSELLTRIGDTIHSSYIKRLIYGLNDLYQMTLLALFLGCTVAICVALLMIQLQIDHSKSNEIDAFVLFESVFCGFWSMVLVFVVCELTQRYMDSYSEINAKIWRLDLYLLPIDIQPMILIALIYSQQPLEFKFYGSMTCSREQFKRVVNKGYKTFTVLREILK